MSILLMGIHHSHHLQAVALLDEDGHGAHRWQDLWVGGGVSPGGR